VLTSVHRATRSDTCLYLWINYFASRFSSHFLRRTSVRGVSICYLFIPHIYLFTYLACIDCVVQVSTVHSIRSSIRTIFCSYDTTATDQPACTRRRFRRNMPRGEHIPFRAAGGTSGGGSDVFLYQYGGSCLSLVSHSPKAQSHFSNKPDY
jgi:hypothetical protein